MIKIILQCCLILFCLAIALPASGSGKYKVIYAPKDALQCRIDLIEQAQNDILLSYYIIEDDVSGTILLDLLAKASMERGIKVKILMDKNGSKISKPMRKYLEESGVEIHRFFLKNLPGIRKYYHGLHEKVFIADTMMMVGGRNLKDEYYSLSRDFNFRDYDILTSANTLLQEARFHFNTCWDADRLSEPYTVGAVEEKKMLKLQAKIASARLDATQRLDIKWNTSTNWLEDCEMINVSSRFIHDNFIQLENDKLVLTDKKDRNSTRVLIGLIDSAEHSVVIENPYFSPTKVWQEAFKRALDRGVKIRLLTNSVHSTDLLIRESSYMAKRCKLLKMGIDIWEHQEPDKLHSKTMVIDSIITIIGSYNVHRPSVRYNTETSVWVKDSAIAAIHLGYMDTNLDMALHISKDNKTIRDPNKNFKRASLGVRLQAFILKNTIARAFRWLL